MAFVNKNDVFYRPLWRRVAIVASTALWSLFEIFYAQSGFWSVIAVAVFAFSLWTFIISWKDQPPVGPS